eukprot:g19999.t1
MLVHVCAAAGLEQRRRDAVAAGTEAIVMMDWSNDKVVQWLQKMKLHPDKISEDTLRTCREHNIDGRVLLALDGAEGPGSQQRAAASKTAGQDQRTRQAVRTATPTWH